MKIRGSNEVVVKDHFTYILKIILLASFFEADFKSGVSFWCSALLFELFVYEISINSLGQEIAFPVRGQWSMIIWPEVHVRNGYNPNTVGLRVPRPAIFAGFGLYISSLWTWKDMYSYVACFEVYTSIYLMRDSHSPHNDGITIIVSFSSMYLKRYVVVLRAPQIRGTIFSSEN